MIESSAPDKPKSTPIDVGAQQVGAVYAKALLGAADKTGQTDAVVAELESVAAAIEQFPQLEVLFGSALVEHEDKVQVLDRVFGPKVSPLVLDFLKVLSRHGRLNVVRAVSGQVRKLDDELRGRVRVALATATPLAEGLSRSLQESLRTLLGGQPYVDPAVEPSLIGGIVLRVGDTVYDGSVVRQLRQIRERMITRSIHEIQSRRDRFRHPGGD